MTKLNQTETRRRRPLTTWLKNTSLRTRLMVGIVFIAVFSILGLSFISSTSANRIVNLLLEQFGNTSREQSEQQLNDFVVDEAASIDDFFQETTNNLTIVSGYITTLIAQQDTIGDGRYWDAATQLTQLGENQWGNSATDPSSVLAPSTFELTEAAAKELNATIYLDFLVPELLAAKPEIVAIYYLNTDGITQYFPNIDLANVVGDFDARERPYYRALLPETGVDRSSYWTVPYLDAALGGLIETNSVPVYDSDGNFRGVVGADVQITTITSRVANLNVNANGYAFMIDSGGRFISIPEVAYADFGLDSADVPSNGIPKITGFNITTPLRPIMSKMTNLEQGVEIFTQNGVDKFIAYAPVQSAGYSLGIVVSVNEIQSSYFTTRDRVAVEANSSFRLGLLVTITILIAAVIIGYLMSRVLTRPLAALTSAAEEVTAGNLHIDINTDMGGEFGTLAKAFKEMTAQLRSLIGSLEQRVANRTQALETSAEISRRLSTILDQQQLVSEVVNEIRSALNYYHAHIYIFDEQSQKLVMAGGTGRAGKSMLTAGHSLSLDQGLVGQAASMKEPVLIPDVSQNPRWLPNPLLPDTKAELAVPILMGNTLLGVLDVQHNVANGLSDEDVRLLQTISNQIAVALRNARLYERAQRQADQEAVINQIGQRIRNAVDIESVLQIAAHELGDVLGVQRTIVQIDAPRSDQATIVERENNGYSN